MKYLIILLSLIAFSCSNGGAPVSNDTAKEVSYARTVTGGTKFQVPQANGDTLVITYTPSAYTPSIFDTVVKRKGSTTPPVDPPTDPPVEPPVGNYGTMIYENGFDTKASLDPFGNGQIGNGSLSATIYKTGPGAFKSVPANVSSGIRSEVQFPSSLTPSEGAFEYDVMYETIFSGSGHSFQIHPNTGGGSASPGLWHENGKFVWVNWRGGTNTKYPTNFTIPRNKWMHVVFEYKYGSQGYMKFTIDGVVVLDKKGIQVNDGSGGYAKCGVNMWASQSSVVYYDNLKIWKR